MALIEWDDWDSGWQRWQYVENPLDMVLSQVTTPNDLVKWAKSGRYIEGLQEINLAAALFGRRSDLLGSEYEEDIIINPLLRKFYEEDSYPAFFRNWSKTTLLDLAIRFGQSQFAIALAAVGCQASRPPALVMAYVFGEQLPEVCADACSMLGAATAVVETNGLDDILFTPLGYSKEMYDYYGNADDSESDDEDSHMFRVYINENEYGKCRDKYNLLDVAILEGAEDIVIRLKKVEDGEGKTCHSFELKDFLTHHDGSSPWTALSNLYPHEKNSINEPVVSAAILSGMGLCEIRDSFLRLSLFEAVILDGRHELAARFAQCGMEPAWTRRLGYGLVMPEDCSGGRRLCEAGIDAAIAAGIDIRFKKVRLNQADHVFVLDAAILCGQASLAQMLAMKGACSNLQVKGLDDQWACTKEFIVAFAIWGIACDQVRSDMSVSITLWARQVLLHMAACEQHICQGFRLPSVVKYKVNECLFQTCH